MEYQGKTKDELVKLCRERGIRGYSGKKRIDLINLLHTTIEHVDVTAASHVEVTTTLPVEVTVTPPDGFTFIDLFCGIGGFHQAMTSLGGTCVLACDIDAKCRDIYNTNYGLMPKPDVTKLVTADMPDFDVLCGGFPCQAFSHAGKQEGLEDTRGTLFRDVARILTDKQPRYFLLENVKNLKGHDEGRTWATIYASLCQAGYRTYKQPIVMSPHHFGIPQHRERVIIMGVRIDLCSDLPPLPILTPQRTDITKILIDDADVPQGMGLSATDLGVVACWETFVQHFKQAGIKLPTFPLWSMDWDGTGSLDNVVDWKANFISRNRAFYKEHVEFVKQFCFADANNWNPYFA